MPLGIALLVMMENFRRGPTCQLHVQTGTGQRVLPMIARVSRARNFLEAMRSSILATQAEMTLQRRHEQIQVRRQETEVKVPPPPIKEVGDDGKWHAWLFGVCLAVGAPLHTIAAIFVGVGTLTLSYIVIAAEVVLTIVALVRQQRTNLPVSLRQTTVWAMVYLVALSLVHTYGAALLATTQAQAPFSPTQSDLLMRIAHGFAALCTVALGIAGLICLVSVRRAHQADEMKGDTPLPGEGE